MINKTCIWIIQPDFKICCSYKKKKKTKEGNISLPIFKCFV